MELIRAPAAVATASLVIERMNQISGGTQGAQQQRNLTYLVRSQDPWNALDAVQHEAASSVSRHCPFLFFLVPPGVQVHGEHRAQHFHEAVAAANQTKPNQTKPNPKPRQKRRRPATTAKATNQHESQIRRTYKHNSSSSSVPGEGITRRPRPCTRPRLNGQD